MRALCYLPTSTAALINDLRLAVRAAGAELVQVNATEAVWNHMESHEGKQSVLVTSQDQVELLEQFEEKYPETLVVLLIHDNLLEMNRQLRECLPIHSFVALTRNEVDPSDFVTLFRKLRTKDIFGVNKYLTGSTEIVSVNISNSGDKKRALQFVSDSIEYLGGNAQGSRFEHYARKVTELVDELILNALFNANTRYRNVSRSSEFSLNPTESIRVQWGFDGRQFGISVHDQFGLLTKETVLKYLDSALDMTNISDRNSAGLGFRTVYERLHKFIVNVNPGFITEIVCLMHFDRRMRDFDERPRSFHFFTL